MRPQPLIPDTDVEASSRWYQTLLGCQSGHGAPEYKRLPSGGVGYTVVLAGPDSTGDGTWRPGA